jgi:cysteine desulfurase
MYLDHAATTPVRKEVLEVMLPYFSEKFANPSSLYSLARENRRDVEVARAKIAEIIGAEAVEEVIFTSGGTESCNLAIDGVIQSNPKKAHIIISAIEHSAVLNVAEKYDCTVLEVDQFGKVDPKKLKEAIRPETGLISIMYANNEIGTVQDIQVLSQISHEAGIPFHTDACQAASCLDIDIQNLGVDLMTLNGSKIYGPKGVGILYKKDSILFKPQILGGDQESGMRAGTENVPGIIGFAKALELITNERKFEVIRLKKLQANLIEMLQKNISEIKINGHLTDRIPNNVNISIDGVEGESVLVRLDQKGIFVSTGSACSANNMNPSHVLTAIGLNKNQAHSSLRISLGHSNNEKDLEKFVKILSEIVSDLRQI